MVDETMEAVVVPAGIYTPAPNNFPNTPIDYDAIETEDDEPVDNFFSAKQQRLLVEPLYGSWRPNFRFLADANVGLFRAPNLPPVVPDMFLSLNVAIAEDWYTKENRTYYLWKFGKPPDLCVEIVSNLKGGELRRKLERYAEMGVSYYLVFDPQALLVREKLRLFELVGNRYQQKTTTRLDDIGLSVSLWHGVYEEKEAEWLRWGDHAGNLIPTHAEQTQRMMVALEWAEAESRRAEAESRWAKAESRRADEAVEQAKQATQRVEQLAARLLAMGIDPNEVV